MGSGMVACISKTATTHTDHRPTMAERRKSKKNEGDELETDGAEQKGGAEGKEKTRLTGALARVRRRSSSKASRKKLSESIF